MGRNKIRRLLKEEQKWIDKNAERHKHSFKVHAVARLNCADTKYEYYDVMKCEHCNSFITIPREGSNLGFITGDYDKDLPMIKLYKNHKYIMGFKDTETEKS